MGKGNGEKVSQNPMDYVTMFGAKGLKKILDEAKGREIVFKRIPNTDGYTYEYKEGKEK